MRESTPPTQAATAVSPLSRRSALTYLHFAVVLFGFAALFGKWIALAPPLIVFGRTVVAAAALAALLIAQRKSIGSFDWRLPASGAVLAAHWLAFFQAVQVSTVATALLGFASFPLFIVILETLTGGPALRKASIAAAIAVTVGLIFVVPDAGAERNVLVGLLWGLLSGFTFAVLAIANRALTATRDASVIACWQNSCAALCTLPLVIAYPAWPSPRDVGLIVVLGVVCTAAAHTMFIRSMKVVTAHTAGTVTALEPVYGIVLAACLIGEIPPARTLIGAAIIVGTSVVVSMRGGR